LKKKLPLFALVAGVVLLEAAALRLWRLDVLPPGLWYDEAINGVDIRMVLSGQGFPLYFAANSGREPLFLYLQALSVALLGPTPLGLRTVSAFTGIATVAAVHACGGVLFRSAAVGRGSDEGEEAQAAWLAPLAAAILAVSYWHLSLSRLGLRAILLPLLSTVAIMVFWRAWSRGRVRDYAWAGAWLGLSLYTYTSARLLPLVPILFILTEIGAGWLWPRVESSRNPSVERRARLRGLAVALLVALLASAPLVVETVKHSTVVLGRAGYLAGEDEATGESAASQLGRNTLAVVRAFYDRGDANVRHNLPGRPATDPLTAVLFTAGWLSALAGLRDPRRRLLLIWLAVMLLPSVLSSQAPHALRASGALPPFALLAAMGGGAAARRLRPPLAGAVLPALLAAVLLVSAALTARDYFLAWPRAAGLEEAFTVREQRAAEQVRELLAASAPAPVRVRTELAASPNLVFLVGAIHQEDRPPAGLPGAQTVDGPAANEDERDGIGPEWLLWRAADGLHGAPVDAAGGPWQPGVPLDLRYANGLRLVGYDVEPDAIPAAGPASSFRVALYWNADEVDAAAAGTSEVFTHFVAGGAVVATRNGAPAGSYRLAWPALRGLMVDIREVVPPSGTPAGKAWFEVGLYTRKPLESYRQAARAPLVDAAGQRGPDQVEIAAVMVGRPPPAADVADLTPLGADFEGRIVLEGWRVDRSSGGLEASFCWRAERRLPTDLTAFVHLLDSSGAIVSQRDAAPGGAENPTSRWVPGETVCSRHALTLPPGAALADYRLRVGLYEPVSGRQWRVSAPGTQPGATFVVLDVAARR
jgi:4-amino-4-deoxy-L-arabinose transferase-like glycosyltransferase